jgi:hypothetical protein
MNRFQSVRILASLFVFYLSVLTQLSAGIVVLNGLSHVYTLTQGERRKGKIEIQNSSAQPQAVKVYLSDYSFNHNGESFYTEPGTHPRSNARWLQVSPMNLVLQGKEKTEIYFEVTIPATDSIQGSFWCTLMIEEDQQLEAKPAGLVGINTVMRYAIQIVTNIGESGRRELAFLQADLYNQDEKRLLQIDLENTGERFILANVTAELFDSEGKSTGIIESEKRKTYPGTSARFTLDLTSIPSGTFKAVVLADCGDDDVFGTNLTLELKDD